MMASRSRLSLTWSPTAYSLRTPRAAGSPLSEYDRLPFDRALDDFDGGEWDRFGEALAASLVADCINLWRRFLELDFRDLFRPDLVTDFERFEDDEDLESFRLFRFERDRETFLVEDDRFAFLVEDVVSEWRWHWE